MKAMIDRRPRGRGSARGAFGRRTAFATAITAVIACSSWARPASADWLGSLTGKSNERFCPFVYGPACETSMSIDVTLYYQQSRGPDNGNEDYFRPAIEAAVLRRIGRSPLHFGAGIEAGGQDGEFMTGYHVTPRARLRFFPGYGPVAIELASGPFFKRSWIDAGVAGRNFVGISHELSIGVLGFASLAGGVEILANPTGVFREETQLFIGARLSLLTVLIVVAQGFRR